MNVIAMFVLAAAVAGAPSTRVTSTDWMPLIRGRDYQKARRLCEGWLSSSDAPTQAEAHKCLANVELGSAGEHKLRIQADQKVGGFIGAGYDDEPALRALKHLDAAVNLAPQDLSIHQGRLHVLEMATMYERMRSALEQSAKLYKGGDALDAWLAYPAELFELRQLEAAESLLRVLDRCYPGDHRIAGNFAAVYGMMERDDQALAWATKAVTAAPNDPIDNWNLARIYDLTGKVDLADAAYQKSLALLGPEQRSQASCHYAEFLEQRKKDLRRACDLQKQAGCSTSACRP